MVRLGAVTHTTPDTDAALIGRSWQQTERFAAVFDRYYPAIHGYVSRRLGRSLADDGPRRRS